MKLLQLRIMRGTAHLIKKKKERTTWEDYLAEFDATPLPLGGPK